ncbi:MAG: DegT/DnrJ/EryC1/StrS family aminotransferase, partial [Pseudomonadales bacterium]|nr:DegT/DnrJ/EryC1/StrS family aminotransferase [Pseudomonadales bacterium]
DIDEVVDTLKSGWIGTGPKVKKFEAAFAQYKETQTNHAIAVNSCTAALQISMRAIDIQPGDEVITTPLTFCATVNAIIHSGATPVLADVDPNTWNINPAEIEKKITPKTKAIIPVHYTGLMCDMEKITSIAKKHKLLIIEDCAHAIETKSALGHAGTIGDFGCFSFYVTKNLVTAEGGMVLAKSTEYTDRIKRLALHGMSKDAWHRFSDTGYVHYTVEEPGYKFNMTDIQAALGVQQIKRVETNWKKRQEIWHRYQEAFKDLDVRLPLDAPKGEIHGYHLFPIVLNQPPKKTRETIISDLHEKNIGTGVHYLSLPEHHYYKNTYGWQGEDYPVATDIGRNTFSIPLSPSLTEDEIKYIIDQVRSELV